MDDLLLKAKQAYLTKTRKMDELEELLKAKQECLTINNTADQLELFAESIQKLKRDMETMGVKPNKEKLFGRPFKA